MFKEITFDLGNLYRITAVKEQNDIAAELYKNKTNIGKARLTTDNVDVMCITGISIADEYINTKFNDKFTLGEIFIKFLMKFPSIVRKPEFRFILDVPVNLKDIIEKHHFDRGDDSNLINEILVRKEQILPEMRKAADEITFTESVKDIDLDNLLSFLKVNAYWQEHLTLDRLKLIVDSSHCFLAFSNAGEIVGFSRVLTNNQSFASLWDVVVKEQYRGKGIGTNLMCMVFTNKLLIDVKFWVLFTDTAKALYQKFGFVSEGEIEDRKLVHKLRLQESHPAYMAELIQSVPNSGFIHLNPEQAFNFLFGEHGKRTNLSSFWQKIPNISNGTQSKEDQILKNTVQFN